MTKTIRYPKGRRECPCCGSRVDVGRADWACVDQIMCCAHGPVVDGALLVRERRSRSAVQPELVGRLALMRRKLTYGRAIQGTILAEAKRMTARTAA